MALTLGFLTAVPLMSMSGTPSDTEDYLSLFLNNTPLLDVRSPFEHGKGSFPRATNIPILNNEQRVLVGTCYKRQGHHAAVALGHRLATDEVRQQRMAQWLNFVQQHPNGYLFCFRGGERSHITQAWLKEAGYHYPLVTGGYKAMRQFLLEQLEETIEHSRIIILSGKTGTGKTRLLQQLEDSIDLEGLANHRGSSFGRRVGGQPSQIDFENRLAIALLKHRHHRPGRPLLLEDESKLIGRCSLPQSLRDKMQTAPVILLEETLEKRVQIGLEEYIQDNFNDLKGRCGNDHPQALEELTAGLRDSLARIKKRLGGLRYQQLSLVLESAISEHQQQASIDGYKPLIAALLTEYYDPMYDYQLTQKQGKILFRGDSRMILSHYPHLTADRVAAMNSHEKPLENS